MKFVLIHGAWQGGWCWNGVVSRLEGLGHSAWAPTLRGSEAGNVHRAGVTLQDMADGVATALLERDLRDVILVGHSGGGPVIQLLANRLETRVQRLVFVDALVLLDGESIFDLLPKAVGERLTASASSTPDATIPVDPERWKQGFMQDGTPEQVEAVLPQLVPYPIGWSNQPIHLTRFFPPGLASSYIFLRQDLAFPRETCQRMAHRLGNPKMIECDGGHEAMLTESAKLTEALLTASS
jgi:pimeloyl-ACP methyl ester carboxylesterase